MKPTLILLFGIIAVFTACNNSTPQSQREAMTSVFRQRLLAREKSTRILGYFLGDTKPPTTEIDREAYLKELHKIDTSGCPKDFRLAWLDYVQAWERNMPLRRLGATVEYGAGVAKLSGEAVKDASTRLDAMDTTEAFRKVIRIALEHDVTAPQDPP